jgi:hypothetical protein
MRLFFRLLFIGGHPIGFSGQRLLPTSTVSDLKQTVGPGGLFGTIGAADTYQEHQGAYAESSSRPQVRVSTTGQVSGLHGDCRAHAGFWYWRDNRDFLDCGGRSVAAAAVP